MLNIPRNFLLAHISWINNNSRLYTTHLMHTKHRQKKNNLRIFYIYLNSRHGRMWYADNFVCSTGSYVHVHIKESWSTTWTANNLLLLLLFQRNSSFTLSYRQYLVNSRSCLPAVGFIFNFFFLLPHFLIFLSCLISFVFYV